MTRILPLLLLATLAASSICHAEAADRIGIRNLAVPAPERGASLEVTLWYPAVAGGTPALVGDSPVFAGTPADRDAPIANGPFPIILLSHGGLRAAPGLEGWIAARLAAEGFLVAVPERPHPGSQKASDAIREIWLRPADLSATLTALERDPALADKIDAQEVGVLGFLLGGSSALALAGARRDAPAYARSCDGGAGPDCAWFAKSGVDLHRIDIAEMERPLLDPRIKAAIAVDPELTATFTGPSLAGIAIPVHLINLGRPDTMPAALNAADLAERIPHARYERVQDATHFDSFSLCKPEGLAILRDDGDDPALCEDGMERRAAIHDRLAAMIAAVFKRHLQSGM